jgi:hypothetical protein
MVILVVVLVLAYVALVAAVAARLRRQARREDMIDLTEAQRSRLVSLDRARANRYQPRHLKKGDN